MSSPTATTKSRTHRVAYLFSASLFLFGSGYSCPPPDHIDPDGSGDGGAIPEADNAWDKFVDRVTEDCIELPDSECDGYPGRGEVGRNIGERFRNFIAGSCLEEGEVFDSAQMFQLDKDGVPKYKSIVLITGHDD